MPSWKPCPIEVSSDGRVRFLGQEVKPMLGNGYAAVSLAIHRLVATAFFGPPPGRGYVVDHRDGNRRNNRASNLQWLTCRDNTIRGKGRPKILTDRQVTEIRRLRPTKNHISLGELARSFGVAYETARSIRSGHTHAGGFSKTNRTVLTEAQVKAIRSWRPPEHNAVSVARRYNVSPATILNIWHAEIRNQ